MQVMENITRKQPLPKIPTLDVIAQIGKTKYSWSYIFVQEVPRMPFIMIGQSQISPKQLNNLGLQNWVKPIPVFEPKINPFQNSK